MPLTPCGCEARHVLPVPGVPTFGAAHFSPASMQSVSSADAQQSALAAQRQSPASQTPLTQSDASAQRTPFHCGSTPSAFSVMHGLPVPSGSVSQPTRSSVNPPAPPS